MKNKPQEFTAMIRDRDDDARNLKVEWFRTDPPDRGMCPGTLEQARAAVVARPADLPPTKYRLLTDRYGYVCFGAIVTDKAGASAFAVSEFNVQNVPPTARIELVSPMPLRWVANAAYVSLFSQAHLTARASRDPDEDTLTYRWKINDADSAPGCAGTTSATEMCRTLDQPGDYRFQLEVSDGSTTGKFELPVSVMPDAPPCIRQTEPPFGLPRLVAFADEQTKIQVVEVGDDGDPFPAPAGQASQTAFVWRFRYVGATEYNRLVSTTVPFISFSPGTYRPGEEVDIRLDVFDRVPERDFRACEGKADCELEAGSGCRQRVSWRVSFL